MSKQDLIPSRQSRLEKGQALILIAVAFVALLAFVGLVVDVGMLFIRYAHLRRGVDAASLSAAAQFREFRTLEEMTASATEFLRLNEIPDASAVVEICDPSNPEPELCAAPWSRKLVRVRATTQVNFSFMPILGINHTQISAEAIGEAASLDVVLVLDRSESMSSDSDPPNNPAACNPDSCQPFEAVRDAAAAFIDNLYFPYDRVAIVTFDYAVHVDLNLTDDPDEALEALEDLTVATRPDTCEYEPIWDAVTSSWTGQLDPSSCTTTNIGGGLRGAGAVLSDPNFRRRDSLWVIVLLTDGAANHTVAMPGFPNGYCPSSTWIQDDCNLAFPEGDPFRDLCPICRDIDGIETRHDVDTEPDEYDAEDYARDQADALADLTDRDIIIFTIGLGAQVTNTIYGEPDAGEELLLYIADLADGSYYASATPDDLGNIFEDIAQRIFTRITK